VKKIKRFELFLAFYGFGNFCFVYLCGILFFVYELVILFLKIYLGGGLVPLAKQ
jgi:hypothetical protein